MFRDIFRNPRRVQKAFVAFLLILAAAVSGLGWLLIEKDDQLETKRMLEERETMADLAVASVDRHLSSWQQRLLPWAADPAMPIDDVAPLAVLVRFSRQSVESRPRTALVYSPVDRDSSTPDATAATLVQIAAAALNTKQFATALASYQQLEKSGPAPVAGMPAQLVARLGRMKVFARTGQTTEAVNEARSLKRDLDAGTLPLSFATYKHLANEARQQLPPSEQKVSQPEAIADSVTWLWDEWSGDRLQGRWISRSTPAGPVLLIWASNRDRGAVIAATATFVERDLLLEAGASLLGKPVRLSLDSRDDNTTVLGTAPMPGENSAIRLGTATGLPWTIRITTIGSTDPRTSKRRALLVTGFVVMVTFVMGGAWFVGRGVTRELEVARLKSDFVAAVSHEFRTPLTTLVQLSELLKGGRVTNDVDRQAYYDLLSTESSRLRRLIERLLSFGQVESGRVQYRFENTDIAALVKRTIDEFSAAQDLSRHELRFQTHGTIPAVAADREALSTVIWNLLENAVKYSPDGGPIDVTVHASDGAVWIAVADAGIGISVEEQHRIFEPFVRGAEARDRQIRGSGIGLALVSSIVNAHAGTITVSGNGKTGSRFVVGLR